LRNFFLDVGGLLGNFDDFLQCVPWDDQVPAVIRSGGYVALLSGCQRSPAPFLQDIDGTRKIASVADLGFWEKYRQIPAPNALVVSKKFVDQDPAAAKRFLAAYWKSQQWVIDNQAESAKISAKISKQSEDEWLAWEKMSVRLTQKDQAQQMSDKGAYPIMDKMIDFMHDTIKKIDSKPNYREWVRDDLVTGQ